MSGTVAKVGALALAGLVGAGAALSVGFVRGDEEGEGVTVVTVEASEGAAPARFNATAASAMTLQEIYRARAPGVVQVISGGAQGSGFVIDKAGHIVTNYHVVAGSDDVQVNFSSGDGVGAKVVGVDASTDIALLKIDAPSQALTPVPLGNSDAVHVGDEVVAIGNPFGLERTATAGIVSALQRDIRAPNGFTIAQVIQTDAAINHGNSGGPLLNTRGEVIGVNSKIETGGEGGGNVGIGFAVPINTVGDVVAELIKDGKAEHAYVGITMTDVGPDLAEEYRLPVDKGALVIAVKPESPAQRAGLEGGDQQVVFNGENYVLGGDIITRADGQAVDSADDLQTIVMAKNPGEPLKLEIHRGNNKRTVSVRLGRQPNQPAG